MTTENRGFTHLHLPWDGIGTSQNEEGLTLTIFSAETARHVLAGAFSALRALDPDGADGAAIGLIEGDALEKIFARAGLVTPPDAAEATWYWVPLRETGLGYWRCRDLKACGNRVHAEALKDGEPAPFTSPGLVIPPADEHGTHVVEIPPAAEEPSCGCPPALAPPAPDEGPFCEALIRGYECTAVPGHKGDHVAYGTGDTVCHTWPQEAAKASTL